MSSKSQSQIAKALVKKLKSVMQEKDMKQCEFAQPLKITKSFLSEIINCKTTVSIDMLEQISNNLSIPVSVLIAYRLRPDLKSIKNHNVNV